ncbi:MAG TPA: TolC family protein [Puia sp.]|nr:TolC family protein [Puia sp.]
MRKILFHFFLLLSVAGFAQDRDLDYYIGVARLSSPLLKDYQNQILSNRADSEIVRASYRVQVNGISADSYSPVINGWGYDNIITNGGQLSAVVQASKNFVSKNNLATQLNGIHLQNQLVDNTSAITEKDLRKTVTAQYIVVYGDMTALNFNKETLGLLAKEDTLLRNLTQSNIYKQADYLTFYVSFQQQQLAVRQSEIQYKNDYAMLNYLCGIVDTAVEQLPDPKLNLSGSANAYSAVFYQQYAIDSLKFINDRSVIGYSYKPKLNAFVDAGYNSTLSYAPYKNFGTSFGLTLNVPIYDGKQKQLRYRKVDIAERTRSAYRDFYLHQYDQQVAQLMQQLQMTESLINEINGQIKYADALVTVNLKLLETGNIRITDFVLAINTYLNARHLLNQNYIGRLQIINQINYWEAI